MHGRQGCLVACVWTAPSVGKGFQTHQTQPDVAHKYRTHRKHRTQSPGQESQDATLLYQMQATFLLMCNAGDNPMSPRSNRPGIG